MRGRDSRRRDQHAKQCGSVLEEHRECGRILAVAERVKVALAAPGRIECFESHPPRHALESKRCGEHHVVEQRIPHRFGMQNVLDSFVEGRRGAERENHERDDEAPEVQLATVPQWMAGVGRPSRALHPIEQQQLVGGVDE